MVRIISVGKELKRAGSTRGCHEDTSGHQAVSRGPIKNKLSTEAGGLVSLVDMRNHDQVLEGGGHILPATQRCISDQSSQANVENSGRR